MHRLLGFVAGAVFGFAVAMFLLELHSPGGLALCAVIGGVAASIVAGRCRQRFWSAPGDWFWD
jgi:ABC-type Fe3+-siderophore transport system permease subunit